MSVLESAPERRVFPPPAARLNSRLISLARSAAASIVAGLLCSMGPLPAMARAAVEDGPSWPVFQGGPTHTGALVNSTLPPPLRSLWRTAPAPGGSSGAVIAGSLAVATNRDAVVGVRVDTGATLWTSARARGPLIPPAMDPSVGEAGVAVFAEGSRTSDAAIAALDLKTHRRLWTTRVGPLGFGGPTLEGGTAFVGSTVGALLAFDAKSGRRLWRVPTDGQVNSAPAVSDGRVFAVSENRRTGSATLYALRAGGCGSPTCKPLWTLSPPGQAFGSSSPAVIGSTVYVAFGDSALRAIDASTGRVRWSGRVRGPLFSPRTAPAVAGASVYVLDVFSGLFRLDARTGRRLWDYQFAPSATSSAPIVALGGPSTVYVGLDDGTIAGIDAGSGRLRWKSSLGSGPTGPLAVGAASGRPVLLASSEATRGGITAFVTDPSGRLLDLESPTVLKYIPALRNFVIAFVALMVLLLAVFRYVLRRRGSDVATGAAVE